MAISKTLTSIKTAIPSGFACESLCPKGCRAPKNASQHGWPFLLAKITNMTLDEILQPRLIKSGYDIPDTDIKIVRHKDNRLAAKGIDLDAICQTDRELFDSYQFSQGRNILNRKYFASFLGIENKLAKFIGFYRVNCIISEKEYLKKHPRYMEWLKIFGSAKYYYDVEQIKAKYLEYLYGRVIIDWGKNTRVIAQKGLKKKKVFEILPKGFVKDFNGYLELLLEFNELEKIAKEPEANRVIIHKLTAVNGIYLIRDEDGNQYIGSAYGKDGIWGRWKQYAKTGHGNNKLLKKILGKEGHNYKYKFHYSILQTLPFELTKNEAIAHEVFYKNKLGKKALTLNAN